mmetsp:Transcript_5891/g.14969  ORF Transcript_5891/g.14969 Transcript_5891/m.14969 type:complete len:82 (+) Transcript_5891:1170-1415(+)
MTIIMVDKVGRDEFEHTLFRVISNGKLDTAQPEWAAISTEGGSASDCLLAAYPPHTSATLLPTFQLLNCSRFVAETLRCSS